VDGIAAEPSYLDVWVPPGQRKVLPVETSRSAFAYVFEGSGTFRNASPPREVQTERVGAVEETAQSPEDVGNRSLVQFDSGDAVSVNAGPHGGRCRRS
jgi:redox-sensitive bicupin YhaK (pirin superfamily)